MGDILFALVFMALGVAGSYGLYWLLDKAIGLFPPKIADKIKVLGFITPAMVLVILVLVFPLFQTVLWAFMDDNGKKFVGIQNFVDLYLCSP